MVFTPRFLRVLVNSLGHPDAHLHAAAKRLTEQVALLPQYCIGWLGIGPWFLGLGLHFRCKGRVPSYQASSQTTIDDAVRAAHVKALIGMQSRWPRRGVPTRFKLRTSV